MKDEEQLAEGKQAEPRDLFEEYQLYLQDRERQAEAALQLE